MHVNPTGDQTPLLVQVLTALPLNVNPSLHIYVAVDPKSVEVNVTLEFPVNMLDSGSRVGIPQSTTVKITH